MIMKSNFTFRLFLSSLTFLLGWTLVFSEERQGPEKKQKSGEDVSKTSGVNITDKDRVLFVDGVVAKELFFKTKDLDIVLSNFQYLERKAASGANYDGVVFFVTIKNTTKKSKTIQLFKGPLSDEPGIITAVDASGGPLACVVAHPWLTSANYPYSTLGSTETIAPQGVMKSDLVVFPLASEVQKVLLKMNVPSEMAGDGFYVLTKNLTRVSHVARRLAYDKFKK